VITIVDGKGYAGFSFSEPEGKGPILVRVAQNVRRVPADDVTYVGWWKTVHAFSRKDLTKAYLHAGNLSRENRVPVEVFESQRKGKLLLVHTRFGE